MKTIDLEFSTLLGSLKAHNYLVLGPNYLEIIQSFLKIYLLARVFSEYSVLVSIIIITLYLLLKDIIQRKIFRLEKLSTNDLLLLGTSDEERNTMISVFFFDEKFNSQKIRELLITRAITKNEKLRKKLVRILGSFYWKDVSIEEAKTRIRIHNVVFKNKEEVINFSREEINRPIDLMNELPYEFIICEYENKGCIFFKLDHSMSDGLGMIALTLLISDNYDPSLVPSILKIGDKIPFYSKAIIWFLEIVLFPYYSIRLLLSNQIHKSDTNPLKREDKHSGITLYDYSNTFDFSIFHQVNRKLNVTFNDLMLAVVSSSLHKYSKHDKKYVYDQLICAIPVGLKSMPKNVENIRLKNDILGALTVLKRIEDPIKQCNLISNYTKKTVRNNLNVRAWKYLEFLLNQFMPFFVQKALAKNVCDGVDLAVTNLAGPVKEVSYCGSACEEILPMMSLGIGKCFVIVGTYNNQLRLTVCVDSKLNIDIKEWIKIINDELNDLQRIVL
jgi:hypothetical protein